MDLFKKTETLSSVILAIVLVGYIAYDYRRRNLDLLEMKVLKEHLSGTIQAVDKISQQFGRFDIITKELVTLKEKNEEKQEEFEALEEKYEELCNFLENLIEELEEKGISLEVEVPNSKRDKKNKRNKKNPKKNSKKNSKKSKKESSDEESSGDEKATKAVERLARIRSHKS